MGDPIEKNIMEELLLQTMEKGPQVQEEQEILIEYELIDSDNEIIDDDFHYDKNASKHTESGLHADLVLELDVGGENDKGSNKLDCPSEEKLQTNYSSSEENIYHFYVYDPEKDKFNPQLEVGKEFRQAVRNHGIHY